uniref:Uncharacterized protein n=1 Tax=Lepeophtheirus salmonis TaxID=72036 RepID=A0A0K2TJH0_LEPSM
MMIGWAIGGVSLMTINSCHDVQLKIQYTRQQSREHYSLP